VAKPVNSLSGEAIHAASTCGGAAARAGAAAMTLATQPILCRSEVGGLQPQRPQRPLAGSPWHRLAALARTAYWAGSGACS